MYERELEQLISAAFERLHTTMSRVAPFMTQQVAQWIENLSAAVGSEQDYFKHPRAFPILLLPWWLEKTLVTNPDVAFHKDLVYSTISGYYHVRMVDNLMDGHAKGELPILPALAFFCSQFQMAYQRHFAHDHSFWNHFNEFLIQSCDVTIRDATMSDIDRDQFIQVAARKTCAVKIPLAAMCYKYERFSAFEPWVQFADLFGCWHQMRNDLYDWPQDLQCQTQTYFLSEARRQKRATESIVDWILRTGLDWGNQVLQTWMDELKILAVVLNNQDLVTYLDRREAMMLQKKEAIIRNIENITSLLTCSS